MKQRVHRSDSGFTFIELLVVIVIIATLASVVFVALDPVKRFAQARNSRRWGDVNSILTAIHEYTIDNDGTMPSGINTTVRQLGTGGSGCDSVCTSATAVCLDLSTPLAAYLKNMPQDPDGGTQSLTYYSVQADSNNIITVVACNAELSETIQVSR